MSKKEIVVRIVDAPTKNFFGNAEIDYETADAENDADMFRLIATTATRKAKEASVRAAKQKRLNDASRFVMAEVQRRGMEELLGDNEREIIAEFIAAFADPDRTMRADPYRGGFVASPPQYDQVPPELRERLDEARQRREDTNVRYVTESPHASKPFEDMTLEELRAEEKHWQAIINGETKWGAGVGAAAGFLGSCRRWIVRRERERREVDAGNVIVHALNDAIATNKDRRLSVEEVASLTGLVGTAVYAQIKANGFPAPRKDGTNSYWLYNEVVQWMRDRVETLPDAHPAARASLMRFRDKLAEIEEQAPAPEEQVPGGEATEEPTPEDFRVTSDGLTDFVGLPNKTVVFYYRDKFGFPEADGKEGRTNYWMASTLLRWMADFTKDGRPEYFPTDRFAEIKAKLRGHVAACLDQLVGGEKTSAPVAEEAPKPKKKAIKPADVAKQLSWSEEATILFVGDEGVVSRRDADATTLGRLIDAGIVEEAEVDGTKAYSLTTFGTKVFDVLNKENV